MKKTRKKNRKGAANSRTVEFNVFLNTVKGNVKKYFTIHGFISFCLYTNKLREYKIYQRTNDKREHIYMRVSLGVV